MSPATAGLVPAATLGFTQTSPCFVFPLTDRAANLEELSLLKVRLPKLMLPGLWFAAIIAVYNRRLSTPLHTGNRA